MFIPFSDNCFCFNVPSFRFRFWYDDDTTKYASGKDKISVTPLVPVMYIIHGQSPPPPRTECPELNLPFSDPPKRGADFLWTVRNVYAKIVPKLLALKQKSSRISADVLNNHVRDPGLLCRVITSGFYARSWNCADRWIGRAQTGYG